MLIRTLACFMILGVLLCPQTGTQAQPRAVGNLCQPNNAGPEKICSSPNYFQLGSACTCGPVGAGRIVLPPASWSNACSTRQGVCTVTYQSIGSACRCNTYPGQIIRR